MKVAMTGFAARCLGNWSPLAQEIRSQGGLCDIAMFPRISDPSNEALADLKEHVVFNAPIGNDFKFLSPTGSVEILCEKLINYDLILMTSCIAGPELKIKSELRRQSSNAIIIGLQHGFYQLWEAYTENWQSFDFFGVFGQAFVERFPPALQNEIIPLGLPKLDLISPTPSRGNSRILFCLQTTTHLHIIISIADSLSAKGFEVVFKGHPEFPEIYSTLQSRGFGFVPRHVTLTEAMRGIDYIITTGSTVVLEALQGQIPVAVIPEQAGSEYTPFGIVAHDSTAESIITVFERYKSDSFRRTLRTQFERHTGPLTGRAQHAHTALTEILKNKLKTGEFHVPY